MNFKMLIVFNVDKVKNEDNVIYSITFSQNQKLFARYAKKAFRVQEWVST